MVAVKNNSNRPVIVGDKYLLPGERRQVTVQVYEAARARHAEIILIDEVRPVEVQAASVAGPEFEIKTGPGDDLPQQDDLTRIDGIGRKRAQEMEKQGVRSFQDLAEADAAWLAKVVGVTVEQVEAWQQEAKLATGVTEEAA